MITDKGIAELLTTLIENRLEPLTYTDIEELSGKSASWFFLNAKKLKRFGYLKADSGRYHLNFDNQCVWHLFQAFGWHRVYQLKEPHKDHVLDILEELRSRFGKNLYTVLLTGSLAFGTYDDESDIDLLVITKQRPNAIDINTRTTANIIALSVKDFQDRYLAGDNFILSSLRYGWPLLDNSFIQTYYRQDLPNTSLKEIVENRRIGQRIIKRIYDLAEIGDIERLRENYHSLLVHVSRQLLIKQGEIPGPHRELTKQFNHSDPFVRFLKQNQDVSNLDVKTILKRTRYLAGLL